MGTASKSQASSFKIHPGFIMPSQSPVTVYRDATLVSEYVSQIAEGGMPSEKDMVIFFKRLSETCGVDILLQISFVMEQIIEMLKSTTAGDSDQRRCGMLLICVARFVIHCLTEEQKRKERLYALCTPLAKGLMGGNNLADGCGSCLEALISSEWWTDAETHTVLDVFDDVNVKCEDKSALLSVLYMLELRLHIPHESLPGSNFSYKSFWVERELLSKFGTPVKIEDTDNFVKVIIRIKPLTNEEKIVEGQKKCVRRVSSQAITWTGHPETSFYFDHVADENSTQENLFKVVGYPIVEHLMGGYNCCVFAYGQARNGKTHTMLGDIYEGTPRPSVDWGIIPRVFDRLFSRIEKEKESRREEKLTFTCKCWWVEIYNDQMRDMWNYSAPRELQIRNDVEKGVVIDNLTKLEVRNAGDIVEELAQGSAAANMNRASSSSHRVLTCSIESEWLSEGVTHRTVARLHLVDLADSRSLISSDAEGGLKEAKNINKSHSTLGPVIMKLVSLYNGKLLDRDVKLARLLQDSLGSKSRTTVVGTIRSSFSCSSETLSTLKFGQQMKLVKNNTCQSEAEVLRYEAEVLRFEGSDPGEEQEAIVPFHSVDCMGVPSTQKVSVRQFQDYMGLIHFARVQVYGEGALNCGTPQVTFFDRNGEEKYASVILPYEDFKPTAIFAIPRELKYFPLAP